MPPPVMKLTTDLGDALRFRSLAATEEMARLFDYSVLALSDTSANVSTDDLLGTAAAVTLQLGEGERHFHGIVVRAGLESANGKLVSWRLQLRPRLWLLTRRSDSRIFQDMTVEAIIKEVFTPYSGLAVKWQLTGTYAARPYCVQYRETDFNFVSRLMEEEGMYYFHEHTADEHTLVIVDAMTQHQPFAGYDEVQYRESIDQMLNEEAITEWRLTHELTSGKSTLVDYDYLKPATSLLVNHDSPLDSADAELSHYDFPGLYTEKARGEGLARVRQQELDARSLRIAGHTTTVMALTVGYRFKLKDYPLDAENVDHVLTSTRIDMQYAGYESGQGETQFTCRFGAMRYAHVFRPERITPKPIIPGPQTAVVVGPSGEEIYTDAHGRAKVKFHWDRLNDNHDKMSCWLRVSSAWAGKAWGAISLPRIGQEVVVDFLEGDPDLPLITGRVYNAVQVPPYKLPDHKTVSTLKSQSSIGGTTANANELRFEDEKGKEYIWFQAEKDMRHLVKHNSNTWIKANEHRIVGGNFTEKIGGKQQITVEGISKHLVEGDYNFATNANAQYDVVGTYTLWVGGDTMFECGDTYMNLDKLDLLTPGDVKIGAAAVNIKADSIVLDASQKISLKVGGNFVVIDSSGVSIKGSVVNINTGGSADSAAAPDDKDPAEIPAPDLPAEPEDPLTPAA